MYLFSAWENRPGFRMRLVETSFFLRKTLVWWVGSGLPLGNPADSGSGSVLPSEWTTIVHAYLLFILQFSSYIAQNWHFCLKSNRRAVLRLLKSCNIILETFGFRVPSFSGFFWTWYFSIVHSSEGFLRVSCELQQLINTLVVHMKEGKVSQARLAAPDDTNPKNPKLPQRTLSANHETISLQTTTTTNQTSTPRRKYAPSAQEVIDKWSSTCPLW